MKIDIIMVNSYSASSTNAAKTIFLKESDQVYICDKCNTWEVFADLSINKPPICWCCESIYVRYEFNY